MPNRLFIVGAPKCGTTSLAFWLSGHPEIAMSRVKEPHFYNTDMKHRIIVDRKEYDSLFAVNARTKVLAEASTWYLYSDAAVPNILDEHPDAKFVAMTRDPVQMAISLYYHNRYKMHEPLKDIGAAWAAQESRAQGEGLPRGLSEPAVLQYREVCSLRSMIERLQSRVRLENLLVLRLEDMREDPGAAYRRLLAFAGVSDDGRSEFPVRNEARQARSMLVSRMIRKGAQIKHALGVRASTGITVLNRIPLARKEVPEAVRAEMARALADQQVPAELAAGKPAEAVRPV